MHALQVVQLQEEVVSHLLAKDDTDLDSRNVILEVTFWCLQPSILLRQTGPVTKPARRTKPLLDPDFN